MRKLFSYWTPPSFGDKEKTREAAYAHYIIISISIGLLYSLSINFNLSHFGETHFILLSMCFLLLLFYLNKADKLKSPILVLVIFTMIISLGLMLFSLGVNDEIVLAFPIILFAASLKFDRASLIITLLIQLAVIAFVGYLEINEFVKNDSSQEVNLSKLITLSIILIITAFIVDLLVNDSKTYISKLKSSSDELTNLNRNLNSLVAAKVKFFSIVAHDLRSPFQGLLGIANILENLDDELTTKERKDFVARLNTALKRQYDFLEELLLWGKFQGNVVDFDPQFCNLKEIVERNREILSGNIEKKKLSFNFDSPDEVYLMCDENLISTVIRNLLSNAIKYTPVGGSICVVVKEELLFVTAEVRDTGIGLSDERKQQLFKVEANNSTRGTEDEAGTGLGLILCKEIIEKHLGEISVKSEEGKGASFLIKLPKEIT